MILQYLLRTWKMTMNDICVCFTMCCTRECNDIDMNIVCYDDGRYDRS